MGLPCDHPRAGELPGAKFCPDCGAPRTIDCPACGVTFGNDGSSVLPEHGQPCPGSGVKVTGSHE